MPPRVNHRAKLAELKALRQSGKKAFENYQVDDADNLYDEVDEDGYKKIVRERLNQDDFVVDDNGEGYADDGREDWDRVQHYESDSEEEGAQPTKGRTSKAGRSICMLSLDSGNWLTSSSQESTPGRAGQPRCKRQKHQRILYKGRRQSAI